MSLPSLPAQGQDPWFSDRTEWDEAVQEELAGRLSDTSISGRVRTGTQIFNVRDFGATGDGSTDDSAAIQAAINSAPGGASLGGCVILFPEGQYLIGSGLEVPRAGVRLVGAGGFSSLLKPDPSLTAPVVKYAIPGGFIRGAQVENLRISMNGADCHALWFEGAYDNVLLQNVFVDGLTGSNQGISFVPAPGAPSAVSQTISAINCYVIGASGFTGRAWHLDTVQEMTFINCKGKGGGEGNGVGFYLDDCRGIQFYGCSAAISQVGFDIVTSSRAVVGVTIDGPTIEGCTETLRAVGSTTALVSNVSIRNIRKQVASVVDAGPINLTYVANSVIESGALVVNVNAGSSQVHILTEDITKITDSGSRTSVISWENAAARLGFRGQTGVSFFVGPNEVIRTVNAGTNQAGISLATNVGAGTSMTQLLIGPVDSGGTGFRAIRIPNG